MKAVNQVLEEQIGQVLECLGYDKKFAGVQKSRLASADYQCSGALAASKVYKTCPMVIAKQIKEGLQGPYQVKVSSPRLC